MELDDFKNTWQDITSHIIVKENINLQVFDAMSKKRFRATLKKIVLPEVLGSIVCIACAVFIAFNFYVLTTIAFKITGIITILLFFILPVLSFMSIQQLYMSANINKSYTDTLKDFNIRKIKFNKLQKLNLTLCYLLFVTVMLLLTHLFGRNAITDSKYFFIISYSAGFILLAVFSKWVFKSYNKTISETQGLLSELSS